MERKSHSLAKRLLYTLTHNLPACTILDGVNPSFIHEA